MKMYRTSIKELAKNIFYFLFSNRIIRKCNDSKIYITFDDGPHPENTPKILEVLDKYNVKATFFMVGKDMVSFPDIVKMVADRGHCIAYHSNYHEQPKKITFKRFKDDMAFFNKIQEDLKISMDKIYRPPYGQFTFRSTLWLLMHKWKIIMWSLDSRDSFDSPEQVIKNVRCEKVSSGDILLFHDDYKSNLNILPEILEKYVEKKLEFGVF